MGRVKRRSEKEQNRGNGLLEKWLLGFGSGAKDLGKVEDGKEKPEDRHNLGQQVVVLRRRFEEETGAVSPREGLQGRQKDPALGRDPGKDK